MTWGIHSHVTRNVVYSDLPSPDISVEGGGGGGGGQVRDATLMTLVYIYFIGTQSVTRFTYYKI